MRVAGFALLIGMAVAGAARAGTVEVSFADTPRFTDAGPTTWEERENRATLAKYLQSLGQRYLPADQSLKVEVTDIDLAGEVKPMRRSGRELRIVKGQADWPRISLRYSLESGGKTLRSAEETVSDPDYTHHGIDNVSDPLRYEKRMLQEWFRKRFAAAG